MIKVRIGEILKEKGKSKYWFMQQMECTNYQSLNKLINNNTTNIYFKNLDKICKVLDKPAGEIIVRVEDEQNNKQIACL